MRHRGEPEPPTPSRTGLITEAYPPVYKGERNPVGCFCEAHLPHKHALIDQDWRKPTSPVADGGCQIIPPEWRGISTCRWIWTLIKQPKPNHNGSQAEPAKGKKGNGIPTTGIRPITIS